MRKRLLLLLLLILTVSALTGCLSHGEPHGAVPVEEGDEYYIESGRTTVKALENGPALVTMDVFPKFISGQTGPVNISIPYNLSRITILRVSCLPIQYVTSYELFTGINYTNIEVYLPIPLAYIELVYLLNNTFVDEALTFSFSEAVLTKELHIEITLPGDYGVKYPSIQISPPSSIQTYQLPVLALSGQSNLVIEMSYVKAVTITVTFTVYRTDIKRDLLTLFESLLISVGVPLLIFLGPVIYGEHFNMFTIALKNNLRKREKFYMTLFGVSTTVSLISSVFLQSNVIRAVLQSMGQKTAISIQPYMYLLIGITLLIGGFLVFETNLSSVLARKVELAVLKAIGFHTLGITKMIIIEGLFIGLLAGIIGSLAGTLFAISPYINFTSYYRASPLNKLQGQIGAIFLLMGPVISLAVGKLCLKQLSKAAKMAFIAFLLNLIQFYFWYVVRPFIKIPLFATTSLIAGYCILTIMLTLIFTTSAALYPGIKAGVTKPIEMMRSA